MTLAAQESAVKNVSLLDQIGNTPLIRLKKLDAEFPGVEIHAKAEFFNPGGSVKDRAGLNMILDGERSGRLTRDKILLDATSGNTGIAYAMIGAIKGYKIKLCLPANASHERKQILTAYGAEMVFSDPAESSDGAIRLCREIYEADPDRYFYPDQYNNPANWKAHFDGTAVELMEQTDGSHHSFRCVYGYQRHLHGYLAPPQARHAGSPMHLGAAVVGISRTRGSEAHADRDRAGDLRSFDRRR